MPIQLIVGLGNPGPEYVKTRHNAGVWLVESLAAQLHLSFQKESKFSGLCANASIDGHDVKLLLPTTFMNHSGQSVQAISRFYRIPPEAVLVAHDELDLPVGTTRLKQAGGHGGHNGLRDIITHLGSANFYRLRIGIGRPHPNEPTLNYVLGRPSQHDVRSIEDAIANAIDVLPLIVAGNTAKAMTQLHTKEP